MAVRCHPTEAAFFRVRLQREPLRIDHKLLRNKAICGGKRIGEGQEEVSDIVSYESKP